MIARVCLGLNEEVKIRDKAMRVIKNVRIEESEEEEEEMALSLVLT